MSKYGLIKSVVHIALYLRHTRQIAVIVCYNIYFSVFLVKLRPI